MNDTEPYMISHDDIWTAIDHLAQTAGYSASGLARKAGLDPTIFNKSKRINPDGKKRWPTVESLSRALKAANCPFDEFIHIYNGIGNRVEGSSLFSHIPSTNFSKIKNMHLLDQNGYPSHDIREILKQHNQQNELYLDQENSPISYLTVSSTQKISPLDHWELFPFPLLHDQRCYALTLDGREGIPIFRPESVIVIGPNASIHRTDRILICELNGKLKIRELIKQTTHRIEFKRLSGTGKTEILMLEEIRWISKILWSSQ